MSPESRRFLEKANRLLVEAASMLAINLADASGRTAYLAAFHAAQALISEKTGRSVKTHNGVHSEFLKLTKDDIAIARDLRAFLSKAYLLKAIADYETGPEAEVTMRDASDAIETAKVFVAVLTRLLSEPS